MDERRKFLDAVEAPDTMARPDSVSQSVVDEEMALFLAATGGAQRG